MTDFAKWMTKQMAAQEMSRRDLAEKAEISIYTVRSILEGVTEGPHLDNVIRIVGAMGMELQIVDEERKVRWKIRE